MIVAMKKVTLLCLDQDRTNVLEQLRNAGVMQLKTAKTPDSDDVSACAKALSNAERAAMLLTTEESDAKPVKTDLSGAKLVDKVLSLTEERSDLQKQIHALDADVEALAPWGEFDPALLDSVRSRGLFPYLCAIRKTDFDAVTGGLPENASVSSVSADKINNYVLIVAQEELDAESICAVTLPAGPISVIETKISRKQTRCSEIGAELLGCRDRLADLQSFGAALADKLEFANARDGMAASGKVAWIFGYVPVTGLDVLKETAKKAGIALLIEDPAEDDDQVPTCIVKPKFLNIMDPLFDFIGVTPGYRENDVNLFFLIFFPIFFSMIIGDAGYGFIFIAVTLFFKWKLRKNEAARLPLNLFLMLSICTVIWGWLNGSWCGIPRESLPCFMQGIDFLSDPAKSTAAWDFARWVGLINEDMVAMAQCIAMDDFNSKFIQFICFAIAGVHLASARTFKFAVDISSTWRAFGHLGWAALLLANMILATKLVVYPDILTVHSELNTVMMSLYGVGVVLVIVTIQPSAALNLPFSLVGSFVDVLSYIRLFAVGLAGAYISEKFDSMGVMLMQSFSGWLAILGVICLILVATLGNVLNIALGFLSVLVHAIRLNTLEFSNHIEMQWAGIRFRPFRNNSGK